MNSQNCKDLTRNKTILFLILTISFSAALAQKQDEKVIQFSGVIINQYNEAPVQGVHVYSPTKGYGTTTTIEGFFSLPVAEKDSLIISSIGYQFESFRLPATERDSYTRLIELAPDTIFLEEVKIYPFPTEELLKEGVLSAQAPQEYVDLSRNMAFVNKNKLYRSLLMNDLDNYRYYQNQIITNEQIGQFNSNQFLNPLAWRSFIKGLKKRK